MSNPFENMTSVNRKAREVAATSFSDTKAQITTALMDVHTTMPAIVISFDAEARTVTAQPAIQRVFNNGEGMTGATNLPPCVDVPVIFPSGGGYEITFPVEEGDECLLVFAERCIDAWFDTGVPSPPADYRQHDLSDAFAIVGVRSLARQQKVAVDGMSIGSNENFIKITADDIQLSKGEAKLTLASDKLVSTVDIHCPNIITDVYNINEHAHAK